MTRIEIRCPVGPQRLFAKLVASGQQPVVDEDNLMEFACADCRRELRGRGQQVVLVLHYYNFLGEHVKDDIVRELFQHD